MRQWPMSVGDRQDTVDPGDTVGVEYAGYLITAGG